MADNFTLARKLTARREGYFGGHSTGSGSVISRGIILKFLQAVATGLQSSRRSFWPAVPIYDTALNAGLAPSALLAQGGDSSYMFRSKFPAVDGLMAPVPLSDSFLPVYMPRRQSCGCAFEAFYGGMRPAACAIAATNRGRLLSGSPNHCRAVGVKELQYG